MEVKKDRHSLGTRGGKNEIRGGQGTSLRHSEIEKEPERQPKGFLEMSNVDRSVGWEKSWLGVWTPGRPEPQERSLLFREGGSLKKIRAVLVCLQ